MARMTVILGLLLPFSSVAQAGSWDQLRTLVTIHAKASEFNMCKNPCGRGGTARACCVCFGGDWFGSVKGGHCA